MERSSLTLMGQAHSYTLLSTIRVVLSNHEINNLTEVCQDNPARSSYPGSLATPESVLNRGALVRPARWYSVH